MIQKFTETETPLYYPQCFKMASLQLDTEEYVNVNSLDPLYKFDTHFPDRLGRYKISPETKAPSPSPRANKRGRDRNNARFKTQPITFDEIKEVDEDSVDDSKEGLRHQFAAFSRSMDGLVPGFGRGIIPHPAARDVKDPISAVSTPMTEPRSVNPSSPTVSVVAPAGGNSSFDVVDDAESNTPTDALARLAENHAMDYGNIHPRRKKKHSKTASRSKKQDDEHGGQSLHSNS